MAKIFRNIAKRRLIILLTLAILGCALIAMALILGIDDNLPGILLCYAGTGLLIYAFIHHWKKSKNYVILLVASIIGFVVFATAGR